MESRTEPAWVEHSLWWHVYPLGALGADTTGTDRSAQRTLADLVPWLDHVVELGLSGICLGPVFASSTHGYDTLDYLRVDERLGSDGDLETLVAACHERGIRVMLDGVFNHVGRAHPLVAERVAAGPAGSGAVAMDWDEGGPRPRLFEGHDLLVELDHDDEATRRLVVDVMTHWLDRGVDAWRLDAAYAVPPGFWAGVLPEVRAAHPDVYVVGEVIHGDYAGIVAESGMDAVTQYELWKAIWSGLLDGNFFETAHAIERHTAMLATFVPWTFVGNHDVTRIASRLDDRLLALAVVLLLTLPGTPAVYAGDEHAFRGVKRDRVGGDDEVRAPLPPSPSGLSTLGEPMMRLHQELVGLRRRHPWLHRAGYEQLHLTNGQLAYRLTGPDGALVVALNLSGEEVVVPVDGGEVLAGSGRDEGGSTRLGPFGWVVRAG